MSGSAAIEIEIFRHLFASIAEEMGDRLMRSAYSPNIKERRDYSCALFDAQADTIAQAAHIPVHLGSAPMSVAAVIDAFAPSAMRSGDRFVVNDPFCGGTHLPDITVVAPVFVEGVDRPVFYVANRAHHADVGGLTAGSMPLGTHIDDEGLRLGPSRLDDAMVETICRACRTPDERRGDLRAQLAALQVGIDRLNNLVERFGLPEVNTRASQLQAYTARVMRSVIADIPDGRYAFTDHLDDDGHGTRDIAIACVATVDGRHVRFDFSGSADQVAGPMNAVRAITVSAVNYCMRCLGPTGLPTNSGVMQPVEVVTRPGSVVDAQHPAAVAAGNVETSQRLVDVVFGALAQALPDRICAASCGSMNNLTIGGVDERTGEPFAYYETIAGGAGAGPNHTAAAAVHTHMTNTLNTPVEAVEHAYPLRVRHYAVRRGSGGAGRQRGGDGVVRCYELLQPVEVTLLTERRTRGPYGLNGGQAGAPGENQLVHCDGSRKPLPGKVTQRLSAGQRLELRTPGGGGFGAP